MLHILILSNRKLYAVVVDRCRTDYRNTVTYGYLYAFVAKPVGLTNAYNAPSYIGHVIDGAKYTRNCILHAVLPSVAVDRVVD